MCYRKLLLPLLFLISTLAPAQDVYRTSWKLDGPLLGGGIALLTTAHLLKKKVLPYEEDEINLLDIEKIFRFDRRATRMYKSKAQLTSDIFLRVSFLLPLTILADKRGRNEIDHIGLMYFEGLIFNTALTNLAKGTARRGRPLLYNSDVPLDIKLNYPDARRSFFSGHTSTTTYFTFYTAKMYSDFFPESNWKPIVWSAAVLLPVTTGLFRIRAGKHFFSDVATGFVVGGLIGFFIPELHRID